MTNRGLFWLSLFLGALCVASQNGPEPKVRLPADDSAHSSPLEWWYYTGHLQTDDGRWFGFESCFFYSEFAGQTTHFAVTDVGGEKFEFDQEFSISAPIFVQNGFDLHVGRDSARGGGGHDKIQGGTSNYSLDLDLDEIRKPVFQFGTGFIEFPRGGNTYYYSRELMQTSGTIKRNGESIPVHGTAWFDHQWGNLIFAAGNGAWDWFALQLDNNEQVMLFQFRDTFGKPYTVGGTLTDSFGNSAELKAQDVVIEVTEHWRTGLCVYPSGWDLTIEGRHFHVLPAIKNQDIHSFPVHYWEGASTVTGDAVGRAYVELTGYCP